MIQAKLFDEIAFRTGSWLVMVVAEPARPLAIMAIGRTPIRTLRELVRGER